MEMYRRTTSIVCSVRGVLASRRRRRPTAADAG